ncbi:MAG: iron-siderophore ABC transporter substrate-binding protein [Pseudonocardiaceae bacterium]
MPLLTRIFGGHRDDNAHARPGRALLLTGALCVTLMAPVLSACSENTKSAEPAAPADGGEFPVTITHKLGSTTIPAKPQRVVALGGADADIAVALGVPPVAVTKYSNGEYAPWLKPEIDTAEVKLIGGGGGEGGADVVSLEQVAALKPDLILAGQYFQIDAQYEQLSQIAPTIAYQETQLTDSWEEQTAVIGRALGRPDRAQEVIAGVKSKIDEVRRAHPEFEGKTASYSFHFAPDSIQTINSTDDYAAVLFGGLGLRLSPKVTALEGDQGARISLEQIETLDADVVILAYASDNLRPSLENNPVFQSVPAVKDGRYVPLGLDAVTALRLPSVLSIPYGLDELEPGLTKALG